MQHHYLGTEIAMFKSTACYDCMHDHACTPIGVPKYLLQQPSVTHPYSRCKKGSITGRALVGQFPALDGPKRWDQSTIQIHCASRIKTLKGFTPQKKVQNLKDHSFRSGDLHVLSTNQMSTPFPPDSASFNARWSDGVSISGGTSCSGKSKTIGQMQLWMLATCPTSPTCPVTHTGERGTKVIS